MREAELLAARRLLWQPSGFSRHLQSLDYPRRAPSQMQVLRGCVQCDRRSTAPKHRLHVLKQYEKTVSTYRPCPTGQPWTRNELS